MQKVGELIPAVLAAYCGRCQYRNDGECDICPVKHPELIEKENKLEEIGQKQNHPESI